MHELGALLKHHDSDFKFDHLNNCVWCFLHIINICISHIIALSIRVPKEYLKSLRSEGDDVSPFENDYNDDDDDNGDDDNDNNDSNFPQRIGQDIPKLKLKNFELDRLSAEEQAWFLGMKCNSVKHTCIVIRVLCSSDQRKQDFKKVIKNGNKSEWFRGIDSSVIVVPDLELLHNVKTWWDFMYAIIECLVVLQLVSIPVVSCFNHSVWVWYMH